MTAINPMPPAVRQRRRYRREDILTTASWLLIAVPAAIYFATYGFSAATSLRSGIEGFGILAGLVGTSMILLMLLLAARIPLVEKTFGQDKVILLHSKLGKPAFYFIIGHILLLTISSGMLDGSNIFTETGLLFASNSDMTEAYIAAILLVALVGSSLVLVRKKVPYEAWHIVHLISYAMVLFALPHQLSQSGIFTAGAAATVYWTVLYWGSLAMVLIFRFLLPVITTLRHAPKVASGSWIGRDVYTMEITGQNLAQLKIAGGQFMVFRFLTWNTALQAHPFSISRVPNSENFRITIKAAGAGSKRLTKLKVGTRVFVEGPYGAFTHESKGSRDSLYIGAGIGITPILSLLENAPRNLHGEKQAVIFRTPDSKEIYHLDEFSRLAKERQLELYSSEGSRHPHQHSWLSGEHANQNISIRNYLHDPLNTDVFICGEQSWMNLVMDDAVSAGVPRSNIHIERFTT